MSARTRPVVFAALLALAAWAAAHVAARPPTPQKGGEQPRPVVRPPEFPADEKTYKLLAALSARPVPDDAPPARKARLAQVKEGAAYLLRVRQRLEIGELTPVEYVVMFDTLLGMIDRTYLAAAGLEADPAARAALYEERVAALRNVEHFTENRVRAGTDPAQRLNHVRFYRLGAEADLLQLKDQPAKAPQK